MFRNATSRSLSILIYSSIAWSAAGSLAAQDFGGWAEPAGGWDYVYEAFEGEEVNGEFDPVFGGGSLDGTWTHANGSDEWDGSGPGDQFRPDGATPASPGGAGIEIIPGAGEGGGEAEVLSVVDTGDPRSRGFPDPGSNRKMWFCHDVSADGANGGGALGSGLTLIVRSRLHPDIDPNTPGHQLPDGGVDNDAGQGAAPGYALRDGGKGGHGFYDAQLDRNFSFTPHGTRGYQLPPLVGEGLPPATFLDVGNNSVFHAFWVVIQAGTVADRFRVRVWVDGAASASPTAEFANIQLGDDTDCDGISHLHLGFHSTPQVGGFQIDYFGYKVGAFLPTSPCPGAFAADFDPTTGNVDLSWSPVPDSVDSYTLRRNGADLASGIADTLGSFTDASPTRPSATYELVPIVGGAPRAGCAIASVTTRTVVCPELSCAPNRAAGSVDLTWTPPRFFTATGYSVLRDGMMAGAAAGGATTFTDSPVPPGEHTYELVVAGSVPDACPVNPFCEARLFAPGSIEVAGDGWDRVVTGGVVAIVTTSDGVKSLHFPAGPKTLADSAAFAAEVRALGTGEVAGGRYRVEIRARYDNEVRILNRSAEPDSYVQFNLARTGVSSATDELGQSEVVEQVPNPGGDPTIDSSSSAIVNTDTVGIALVQGLNLLEVQAVDANGTPHDDNMQIFELRIGPFADGLDASLADFPCAAGLSCTRNCDGDITLSWRSSRPHAYEVERDGDKVGVIPMGNTTTFTERGLAPGFFTYTLRVTDDPLCPALTCLAGGGVPDELGAIREWLVLGPLDWGCAASCDAPGVAAVQEDYLAGMSGGMPVDQATIEPEEGDEIALGPQATVRATARADINPGRPGAARWFRYVSPQSLIDYNVVFGGDPGNNYMVYAVTYVNNTTGADIVTDIGLTSDDAVEVYLNDASVWTNNVARGVGLPGSAQWDVVPGVTLREGLNRVLVKVFEGGGDNGFALRFEQFGIPITEGIEVSCVPVRPTLFVRGDSDSNGRLELTDAIVILNFLFLGTGLPRCFDAADGDNNGRLELTDAIRVLNYLFLGFAAPPAPSPSTADYLAADCGVDPVEEQPDLGCATQARKCES